MLSNLVRNDRGFTLVELIMVIVIIGILAAIAVPKFVSLTDEANKGKCRGNQSAINSAVALKYSEQLVANATQANADTLTTATFADYVTAGMFATGAVPACPSAGTYTLVNGTVRCSVVAHQ